MTAEYTPVQNMIRGMARKLRDDARLMRDLNDNNRLEGVRPSILWTTRRVMDISGMALLVPPFKLAGRIGNKVEDKS